MITLPDKNATPADLWLCIHEQASEIARLEELIANLEDEYEDARTVWADSQPDPWISYR